MKKVVIIGAGPGGLSSAMILAHKGYDVSIYESKSHIGGRNSALKAGDFSFELGPTFVMLPKAFEEAFMLAGRDMKQCLDFKELPEMYRLHYANGRDFHVYFDKQKIEQEIVRLFPDDAGSYARFRASQKIKFDRLYKCLTVPYMKPYNYFRLKLLKALSTMDLGKSVHDVLSRYFKNEDLKIAMSFQAKYLGMSPWDCPGAFTILSYIEHEFGIYHPMGGVHKICEAMGKVAVENGAKIFIDSPVKRIVIEGKKTTGIELSDRTMVEADHVIMNADFAHGMLNLFSAEERGKYNEKNLKSKKYSCSTFMLYLGLDKKYDMPHHNIFFSADYKKNVDQIFKEKIIPEDPSFYIQNASVTDPSLAPEGMSTIYVLVPAPNLSGAYVDWKIEKQKLRDKIIGLIKERTEMKDIEDHIVVERAITPAEWESEMSVHNGAVFNLAHSLDQMLYLRPHNRLEGYENIYLVGGGTHPGSGLPTIVESGRIAASLIEGRV
ncbi:MAG TPA: phytoene desaturase family protein [Candidatus Paceibacterota bacterium]|jgi:phytoene desaturase|nr:phytoene desaturase family protein [Candidatus Paceibacterota bacterium]